MDVEDTETEQGIEEVQEELIDAPEKIRRYMLRIARETLDQLRIQIVGVKALASGDVIYETNRGPCLVAAGMTDLFESAIWDFKGGTPTKEESKLSSENEDKRDSWNTAFKAIFEREGQPTLDDEIEESNKGFERLLGDINTQLLIPSPKAF